ARPDDDGAVGVDRHLITAAPKRMWKEHVQALLFMKSNAERLRCCAAVCSDAAEPQTCRARPHPLVAGPPASGCDRNHNPAVSRVFKMSERSDGGGSARGIRPGALLAILWCARLIVHMTCQCHAGPCQEHMTGLFCFTAPHHATARLATAREPRFAVGQLAD